MGLASSLNMQPKVASRIVAAMLLVHTGLLAYSGYVHSPTVNEPAYLVAGLSHWKFGRFELTRVNPPLVRMVASLPVIAAGYEEDWSNFQVGPGAKPGASMGKDFIAANGRRIFWLFAIARWALIPFSLVGGLVCFWWARDLYGQLPGILACMLWCFSPNILAHGSLMTADTHTTALGLAACYTFWKWLKTPTWAQAAVTGVILGLAELGKTTLIVFYPLWPLLWLIYRWPDRNRLNKWDWGREACMLFLRMAIGIYVLNFGYGFDGSGKTLEDYHFVSDLFAGHSETNESASPAANAPQSAPRASSHNRFANSWLGYLPVPFPEQYILGIDHQQSDFEGTVGESYLHGVFQDHGWWYYYLYAIVIKVPLGTWVLGSLALALTLCGKRTASYRDEFILLAPAIIIFGVVSYKSGFNHHMRYVLPSFPFVFVWASQVGKSCSFPNNKSVHYALRKIFPSLVLVAAAWSVTSSLQIFPHNLSYFNEIVGGPRGGPEHLLHSNVDWGQDLRHLKWWMDKHPQAGPLRLAYYGAFAPMDVGFGDTIPVVDSNKRLTTPSNQKQMPVQPENPQCKLRSGWYAVSVNLLYGLSWTGRDGKTRNSGPITHDMLSQLRLLQPVHRCGWSIYVYHIP